MEFVKLPTVGLLIIQDNKILLAYSNNKEAWYLPGGKIDAGETKLQALIRETKEEINLELDPSRLELYCHITAPAYGEKENVIMEQDCYLYNLQPEEKMNAGQEIKAIHYFDLQTYKSEPAQVPGVLQVFDTLIKDGKVSLLT